MPIVTVSKRGDNNAWMAQLLMQGTNFVNFMGRYVYCRRGALARFVPVTERDEPRPSTGALCTRSLTPYDFKELVGEEESLRLL